MIPEGKRQIDYFGQSFERRYTNPLRYGISDGSWENYCDGDKLSRWGQKEAAGKVGKAKRMKYKIFKY